MGMGNRSAGLYPTHNSHPACRGVRVRCEKNQLAYMIRIMRDETAETERRDEMAKAAAPYVHAKLASIDQQHRVTVDPIGELLRQIDGKSKGLPDE